MIYYITFLILLCFGFYNVYSDNKKVNENLFLFSLLLMILLTGLRWETGTDWRNYYRFFEQCLEDRKTTFEIGYVTLNKLIRSFTDQYTVLLIVHAAITYGIIGRSIYRLGRFPLLSLALLFALMIGYMGMNRQYISLALNLFSVPFILERKLWPFLLCTAASCLFHSTGLIFLVAYFFTTSFNRNVYIILLLVAFLVAMSGITRMIPPEIFYFLGDNSADKADTYLNDSNSISTMTVLLGTAKRSVWIVLALIYYNSLKEVKNFTFFFNAYVFSMFVFLVCNNSPLQVITSRGMLAFNIFEIFIIPILLYVFEDNVTRKVFFAGIMVYCLWMISRQFDVYVETLGIDIFNPYRCVLFENVI
ncbi:MAG: EpsG family protein [Bacteroidaceae bacterium]|nr:EpsG family protein [Bacteroidaceae bacterium]